MCCAWRPDRVLRGRSYGGQKRCKARCTALCREPSEGRGWRPDMKVGLCQACRVGVGVGAGGETGAGAVARPSISPFRAAICASASLPASMARAARSKAAASRPVSASSGRLRSAPASMAAWSPSRRMHCRSSGGHMGSRGAFAAAAPGRLNQPATTSTISISKTRSCPASGWLASTVISASETPTTVSEIWLPSGVVA